MLYYQTNSCFLKCLTSSVPEYTNVPGFSQTSALLTHNQGKVWKHITWWCYSEGQRRGSVRQESEEDEMSESQMTNHYMSVSLWVCESVSRLCTSASVCEQHKKKKESVQQRSKSSCAVSACGCLSKKPGRSTLCDSPRDQPPSTVASFKSFSNTNCIWRKINKHFYQDIQWILNGRY